MGRERGRGGAEAGPSDLCSGQPCAWVETLRWNETGQQRGTQITGEDLHRLKDCRPRSSGGSGFRAVLAMACPKRQKC